MRTHFFSQKTAISLKSTIINAHNALKIHLRQGYDGQVVDIGFLVYSARTCTLLGNIPIAKLLANPAWAR